MLTCPRIQCHSQSWSVLDLVSKDDGDRHRRMVAEGAVWTQGIVVLPPSLDKNVGLLERIEDFAVEQLVPEL